MDAISTGHRPGGQIGEGNFFASTLIPSHVLVELKLFQRMLKIDEKVQLEISGWIHEIKMQWDSMERQLKSSGQMSKDFRHCLNLAKSSKTW